MTSKGEILRARSRRQGAGSKRQKQQSSWEREEWIARRDLEREAHVLDATLTRNGSPRRPRYDDRRPDWEKVRFRGGRGWVDGLGGRQGGER